MCTSPYSTIDVAAAMKELGIKTLNVKDMPSVIKTINKILEGTSYPKLPKDFVGAYQEFADNSGLLDARAYALQNIPGTEDNWSVNNTNMVEYEWLISDVANISLVIDYAFYSPDLELTSYNVIAKGDGVFSRDDYFYISDHFPIVTTYEY